MSSESRHLERRGRANGTGPLLFDDVETVFQSMQDIVGRKWHPVIVYYLLTDGPQGFSALKRRIDGISSKMLSQSLEDLEDAGLLSRELLNDKPVRVEYALTDRGESLEPLVREMVRWGSEHAKQAETTDGDRTTGGRNVGSRTSGADDTHRWEGL